MTSTNHRSQAEMLSTSSKAQAQPPPPLHVLETCIYVRDMTAAATFYREILGLTATISSPRLTMFPLGTTSLILFQLGMTETDSISTDKETGQVLTVPGHGPDKSIVDALSNSSLAPIFHSNAIRIHDGVQDVGRAELPLSDLNMNPSLHTHYCLAVASPTDVQAWEEYLKVKNVKLRGVMKWGRGGRSVYFEDVDGHVGEIGSRGIWEHW